MDNIFLCGHTRGGEAVVDASFVNKLSVIEGLPLDTESLDNVEYRLVPLDGTNGLGPYGFGIKAVVNMAPALNSHISVAGDRKPYGYPDIMDNYFLIHVSADPIDEGYIAYDTANRISLDNPLRLVAFFLVAAIMHSTPRGQAMVIR